MRACASLVPGRVCFHFFEITEQVAAPGSRLMQVAIFFNNVFKFLIMVHSNSLPCDDMVQSQSLI